MHSTFCMRSQNARYVELCIDAQLQEILMNFSNFLVREVPEVLWTDFEFSETLYIYLIFYIIAKSYKFIQHFISYPCYNLFFSHYIDFFPLYQFDINRRIQLPKVRDERRSNYSCELPHYFEIKYLNRIFGNSY